MKGEHRHVGSGGKGLFQIHLGGIRLWQDRNLVADVGGGVTGIVHRAADGFFHCARVVHIGVTGNLADN